MSRKHRTVEEMDPGIYQLPDGQRITVAYDLCRYAPSLTHQLASGRFVVAIRVGVAYAYTDERGHAHRSCAVCGADCSTHPDAANPLDFCGDCGAPTCPDHRVEDTAGRCVDCASHHYRAGAR